MSSGGKQEVINTLERAISTDINRLQLFAGMDRAEAYRFLLDVGMGSDDIDASAVLTQTTTLTSPLTAEILNGFCVRPDIGDLNIAVDSGVMYAIAPDADPDSSNYKIVRDPGVTNAGTLAMVANASGSTRIDVVECSYQLNTVETDNRDIFNPATNTFAAATVTKATQAGLVYRVRLGTPGSGFPGTASGWLPLAVASVPNGTTTCDQITFWDVRPIVADRIIQPSALNRDMPRRGSHDSITVRVSGAQSLCTGIVDVTASDQVTPKAGRYRLGGRLRRGTPGTDIPATAVDGLDLADAANQSGVSTGSTNYLYLLEPFGLPRWARYTDASTSIRKPRSPRGIAVVSAIAPLHLYGAPSSAINLPASTGLGSSTTMGVAILALGTVGATTQPAAASLSGGRGSVDSSASGFVNSTISGNVSVAGTITFGLVENSSVVPIMRGFDCTITLSYSTGRPSAIAIVSRADVIDSASGAIIATVGRNVVSAQYNTFGGGPNVMVFQLWVPWPSDYAHGTTTAVRTLNVHFTMSDQAGTPTNVNLSGTLNINSWQQ